ncbi:Hypothetical protein NTJ_13733 [Nesidiocoris tenuis]|uniref:DUF7041 domain-containing protein n=1 Tax=Nesidiocoris tenuis TaxID=355587 RepID=A0ABN7B947_9HEMI|nr:Hypothetical protein NTJ_01903 [Nesidiocoris tenuis]BET00917.1 Hypothetical protein NTJ_13733 [Nesidiocoris tenuis]
MADDDEQIKDEEDEMGTVRIKLPPFWHEKPEIWFYQVETQFRIEKVRSENRKFDYLIAHLEPRYLEDLWDIIESEDIKDRYSAAKNRLLGIFKESEDSRLKKLLTGLELGDLKPSQLLRHMQSLAGDGIADKVLKSLWMDKLPSFITSILVISEENLEKLAAMADRILDSNPRRHELSAVSAGSSASSSNSANSALVARVAALEAQIQSLMIRKSRSPKRGRSLSRDRSRGSRNRSRSRYNPNGKYCYYHFMYGRKCEPGKCSQPCSWIVQDSENQKQQRN